MTPPRVLGSGAEPGPKKEMGTGSNAGVVWGGDTVGVLGTPCSAQGGGSFVLRWVNPRGRPGFASGPTGGVQITPLPASFHARTQTSLPVPLRKTFTCFPVFSLFGQAFTEIQKKRLLSWKQQVQKLFRSFPRKSLLELSGYRQQRRYAGAGGGCGFGDGAWPRARLQISHLGPGCSKGCCCFVLPLRQASALPLPQALEGLNLAKKQEGSTTAPISQIAAQPARG